MLWTDFFFISFPCFVYFRNLALIFCLRMKWNEITHSILNWKFAWFYAAWKHFYMSKIRLVFFSTNNSQFWFSSPSYHSWHVDWVAGTSVQCSTRTVQKISHLKIPPIFVQQNTSIFFSYERYVTLIAALRSERRAFILSSQCQGMHAYKYVNIIWNCLTRCKYRIIENVPPCFHVLFFMRDAQPYDSYCNIFA